MSKPKDDSRRAVIDILTPKKPELVSVSTDKKKETPRYQKGTFYLSSEILERLEGAWVAERAKDRHATKSGLVEKFLDEGLKRLERLDDGLKRRLER